MAGFHFLCPLYVISEIANELIGEWKLVNAKCKDNTEMKPEMPFAYIRDFQANGIFIETVDIPIEEGLICSTKMTSSYTVSDNILRIHLENDFSVEVDCPGYDLALKYFLKATYKSYIKTRKYDIKFKIT